MGENEGKNGGMKFSVNLTFSMLKYPIFVKKISEKMSDFN
jgi:hypothetical protein